jgi:hypothetical protein
MFLADFLGVAWWSVMLVGIGFGAGVCIAPIVRKFLNR